MKRHPFIRLLLLVKSHLNWMLLSALVGFLTIGSSVGLMMTSAYIIAKAALHPSIAELQLAIVGVRFFGIFRGVFRYVERLISHDTTFKILANLRVWFYRSIEPLAPARLQHYQSGDIHNRILTDIQQLDNVFVRILLPPLVAIGILMLAWLIYAPFNRAFALFITLAFMVVGILLPAVIYFLARPLGELHTTLRQQLNTVSTDALAGLEELLLFQYLPTVQHSFNTLHQRYLDTQHKLARLTGIQEALLQFIMNATILGIFFIAYPLIQNGQLNSVFLATLVIGVIAFFEAVNPLPQAFQQYAAVKKSAENLFALVDTPPVVAENGEMLPVPESPPELKVYLPTFSYTTDAPPVLQDLNFILKPGNKLAIVGETGAGKTTIFNVLLRFWPYISGSILLNGRELHTIHPVTVREYFSVITQNTTLFTGTIRENLALANPTATEARMWEVLAQAELADLVSQLPGGLDAEVGTEGLQLSGGERQRLAIARALLKDAPIFLLDEPTANLDVMTEYQVMQTILNNIQQKSLMLITHRLIFMEHMDEIIVLKQGQVVERGTHQSLLHAGGYYALLYNRQHEARVIEQGEPYSSR